MANSLKRRKELMKRYGALYRRVTGFDLEKCAYCDSARQCLDHVPAISLLEGIDVKEYIKKGGKFLLYPSCEQCNKFLTNSNAVSFLDRLDHLSNKYIKKMDNTEVWTDREMLEMGHMMKAYIQGHQYKIQEMIRKLAVIEEKRLNTDYDAFN